MILTGYHSYQMAQYNDHAEPSNHWDDQWQDVPPGKALGNIIAFLEDPNGGKTVGDDAGEAYYRLDGTDHTFTIKASVDTSKSPQWQLNVVFSNGWTINGFPNGVMNIRLPPSDVSIGRQAQFTLTGDDKIGYYVNQAPPKNWMHSIVGVLAQRKLKYVTMPGSHDAGMSLISQAESGNEDNTQTQFVNLYGQLLAGSRWFDFRPCFGVGGEHLLCHLSAGPVGGTGELISDAISEINK
jgi:hypothetical protein